MRAEKFLVTGATGETGRYTVQRLLEKEHAVRALVHKEDERSEALRGTGAEVVVGDLLEHDDAIRVTVGTSAAYFCYPVRPGLIQATAYFADAAKRARLEAVVNLSQISAREDSKSHAARDHWIAERVFDWSGFRSCTSDRHSLRSGCSIPTRARPLSKMASSICPRCRREFGWNLFGVASGRARILDQAARSIGLSASCWVRVCHPSTLRMTI
jgi:NAD(P)-dependent dehydrogenase (short-subunit alcohol dehydrogenase family)